MRIGIISDSDSLIPLVYTLAAQKLQVYIYFSASQDLFVNQKVREFAKQIHIPVTEEKNRERDLYLWLNKNAFDVCFVIGYKYLIKLDRLHGSTPLFNIHFGPLPSFRGPTPVFWQLKQGVEKIGLCIHRLSDKFDEGEVVWIKETENRDYYNYKLTSQLFSQFCVEGALFIIQLIANGLPVPSVDRSSSLPAYQKRPGLDDVLIRWQEMDARTVCNLIRACNPWNKGAITFFKGQDVKLMDATIVNNMQASTGNNGGVIINDTDCLHIRCCDGKTISVNMIFYCDCFIPAYRCKDLGLAKGQKLTGFNKQRT